MSDKIINMFEDIPNNERDDEFDEMYDNFYLELFNEKC